VLRGCWTGTVTDYQAIIPKDDAFISVGGHKFPTSIRTARLLIMSDEDFGASVDPSAILLRMPVVRPEASQKVSPPTYYPKYAHLTREQGSVLIKTLQSRNGFIWTGWQTHRGQSTSATYSSTTMDWKGICCWATLIWHSMKCSACGNITKTIRS
jgi:hypothetical protein